VARKPSVALTDGELRLMRVLWGRGSATVAEVHDAIDGRRKPAYNTVLTLLRILERKGAVRHVKAGRAYVFVPIVDRADARRSAVRVLLARFFDNSPRDLVLNLVEQGDLDAGELGQVLQLVAEAGRARRRGA